MTCFRKFYISGFSFFLSLFLSTSCPCAFANDVGTITYSEGRVDLVSQTGEKAVSLREGDIVSVGDAVRTKSNSKAEVTFKDKSVLRLGQNSKAIVRDYAVDSQNTRKSAEILLERGKARAIVSKTKQQAPFLISTPNAQGRVKGSDIIAFYQGGNSGLLVSEGKLSVVSVAHPDKEIAVPAGTTILVPLDELPKDPRPFLEVEKKLHEQDTYIPPSISKRERATEIKGIFTKLSGDVKVTVKGADSAHIARVGEIIGEGDIIETGDKGAVEIKFDNGNGMNLKANTRIIIVKLVIDPKTGEYENIFESNMGKIRSRIENLKGKSTFEIRTPTAVTGARATIMYTEILPTLTNAYFDGGRGYIKSVLTGVEKSIEAGQNSSADANGNVSEVLPTTDEQRGSNDEGWDPGNGVEGYSSPENDNGSYFSNENTGGITNREDNNGGNDRNNNGNDNTNADVPFSIAYGKGSGGNSSSQNEENFGWMASTNTKYNYARYNYTNEYGGYVIQPEEAGPYEGVVASESSPFGSPGAATEIFLFGNTYAGDHQTWWGSVGGENLLGSNGGVIPEGFVGGTIDRVTNALKGVIACLYIGDDGKSGTFFGTFSGDYFPNAEVWYGIGDVKGTERASNYSASVDIRSGPIYGYYSGSIGDYGQLGNGYLNIQDTSYGYLGSTHSAIINPVTGDEEKWGIYNIELGGSYYNPGYSNTWTLNMVGDAAREPKDCWMAVSSGTWSGGQIEGDTHGMMLSVEAGGALYGGAIKGKVIGDYIEVDGPAYGNWQAVSAGEWVEAETLLNTDNMQLLDDSIKALALSSIGSIPITVYSSGVMYGEGSGGISSASMNMNLYAVSPTAIDGIWAGLVNGNYSGPVSSAWTATVGKEGTSVNLTGTQWNNNQWAATVSGIVNGNTVNGSASGTYTVPNDSGAGTFTGVGAGTWKAPR